MDQVALVSVSSYDLLQVLLERIPGDVVLILLRLSLVRFALLNLLERFFRHISLHVLRVLAKSLVRSVKLLDGIQAFLGGVQKASSAVDDLECVSDVCIFVHGDLMRCFAVANRHEL